MTATFIVTLNVESPEVIPQTAQDLDEDLMQAGHDVVEVKPWSRPSMDLNSAVDSAFPTPPTQPLF